MFDGIVAPESWMLFLMAHSQHQKYAWSPTGCLSLWTAKMIENGEFESVNEWQEMITKRRPQDESEWGTNTKNEGRCSMEPITIHFRFIFDCGYKYFDTFLTHSKRETYENVRKHFEGCQGLRFMRMKLDGIATSITYQETSSPLFKFIHMW